MRGACACTPRTSSTAYVGTGGSARSSHSPSVSNRSRSRRSASKSTSSARLRALLRALMRARRRSRRDATEVTTVARVDLDLLALGDEQRHLDGGAGLESGRLVAAGGTVALNAWLRVGDRQLDRDRELDVEHGVLVPSHGRRHVLEQIVLRAGDRLAGHVDLVVGLAVHEDVVGAVLVEVLHLALVDDSDIDLGAGVEGAVDDLAGQQVLELGADERATLARLDVLELDDVPQHAVEVEGHAVLQVVGGRHGSRTPRSRSARG